MWHSYCCHLVLHHDQVLLHQTCCFLHRVCLGKNVNRHFSLNFGNFCNNNNWLQCLVVFSIVVLLFSAIRSLLREKRPTNSILKWLLSEAKKDTESTPAAPIPPQNHSTGLSTLFQLNSKPNWSPQCTLQGSGFLVHCGCFISCVIPHLAKWELGSGHRHKSE